MTRSKSTTQRSPSRVERDPQPFRFKDPESRRRATREAIRLAIEQPEYPFRLSDFNRRLLIGSIKKPTCVPDTVDQDKREEFFDTSKRKLKALEITAERLLEGSLPLNPENLKDFANLVVENVRARRDVGEVSEEKKRLLLARAKTLLSDPNERCDRVENANIVKWFNGEGPSRPTIWRPPPIHERQPDLSGATVRVLCFGNGVNRMCPIDGSYYWCKCIIENDPVRWIDIPLVDYNNPANWHAPEFRPREE